MRSGKSGDVYHHRQLQSSTVMALVIVKDTPWRSNLVRTAVASSKQSGHHIRILTFCRKLGAHLQQRSCRVMKWDHGALIMGQQHGKGVCQVIRQMPRLSSPTVVISKTLLLLSFVI